MASREDATLPCRGEVSGSSSTQTQTNAMASSSSTNDNNNNNNNNQDHDNNDSSSNDMLDLLFVDCLVDVEDRMWPGVNKQGGIARVTAVDRVDRCVDVHYVVDRRRREKNVPLDFITLAPQYNPSSSQALSSQSSALSQISHQQDKSSGLRDRSRLLGRCNLCGSLRTDCGSCDWIEEERRHRERQEQIFHNQSASSNKSNTKSNQSSTEEKSTRTTNKNNSDKILGLSDSSSDEDDTLAALIQQHRQKIRILQRRKKKQDRELKNYLQEQETEQREALERTAARNKQQHAKNGHSVTNPHLLVAHHRPKESLGELLDSSSDSSGSDSDENVPLAMLGFGNHHGSKRRRRLQKLKQKYVSQPNEPSPSPPLPPKNAAKTQTTKKRKQIPKERPSTASVLESLPTSALQNTNDREGYASTNNSGGVGATSPLGDNRNSDHNDEARSVGSPMNFTQSFTQDIDDDDDEEELGQSQAFIGDDDNDVNHAAQNTTQLAVDAVVAQAQKEHLGGLEGFIQPEGRDVAENLPEDVEDRASAVVYKDLPKFFDVEATRLQDETIPDAKLKVAQLEREFNQWDKERGVVSIDAPNDHSRGAPADLIEKCDKLMEDIRGKLIRDGVDQCRSALRQLLNDSRYRQEKRTLSKGEIKQIKRQRNELGFIRDNRMDELDLEVEAMVKKIRDMQVNLDRFSANAQDLDNSDARGDSESDDNMPFGNDDDYSASPMPSPATSPMTFQNENVGRDLPPWDRHMHARRVRPPLTEAQEATRSNRANLVSRRDPKEKGKKKSRQTKAREPSKIAPCRNTTNDEMDIVDSDDPQQPEERNKQSSRIDCSGSIFNVTKEKGTRERKRSRSSEASIPDQRNTDETIDLADMSDMDDAPIFEFRTEARGAMRLRRPRKNQDTTVPRLDDLFACGASDACNDPAGQRRHRDFEKPSKIKQMQAFLASNGIRSNSFDSSDSANGPRDSPSGGIRQQQQQKRRRKGVQRSSGSAGLQSYTSAESGQIGRRHQADNRGDIIQQDVSFAHEDIGCGAAAYSSTNADYLFKHLRDRQFCPTEEDALRTEPNMVPPDDYEDLCNNLPSTSSSAPFRGSVQIMKALISKTIVQLQAASCSTSRRHSMVASCFQTVLETLQANGEHTLQELITGGDKDRLRRHLGLLRDVLKLMKENAHSHLVAEDGLIFLVFSGDKNAFIKAVVLQLVDSLYAIFHPTAWGNPHQCSDPGKQLALLNALAPLRDALRGVIPLAKVTCQSITSYMACQTWRLSDTPQKRAFISTVDPAAWQLLLHDGTCPQVQKETRLSRFNNHLPRCEVQALWSILAFAAATDPRSVVKSSDADACWRFASKLVLNGTRACKTKPQSAGDDHKLPPSASQLDCCQTEVSFLASILQASATTKWEKHDTTVIEIFKRAVALQADDYAFNTASNAKVLPASENQKNEIKKMRRLWGGVTMDTRTLSRADAAVLDYTLEAGDDAVAKLFGQPAVLPASIISRQCLGLLWAWIQKIPAKKALFNRFVSTVRTLVQFFADKALDTEKSENGTEKSAEAAAPDLFALAFSGAVPAAGENARNRKSLYLKEVAAFIKIVSAIAVKQRVALMTSVESGIKIPNMACLVEEVWNLLADDTMKDKRVQAPTSQQKASYRGDDYRLYVTARTIMFAALSALGIPAWKGENWEALEDPVFLTATDSQGEESLLYPMTCLVACLECLCDRRGCNKVIMTSICTYIAAIYCHACHLLTIGKANPAIQIFLPAIQALGNASIDKFAGVFQQCFQAIVCDPVCGPESETCLLALLSALRGALILAQRTKNNGESTSEEALQSLVQCDPAPLPSDDDPWGGIDDDVFASMDLDALESSNRRDESAILFSFLSEALQSAKPSKRYAIDGALGHQGSPDETLIRNLSVQGKSLVVRQSRYVCGCLALLGAQKDSTTFSILGNFLGFSDNIESVDEEDMAYQENLAELTSAALCKASLAVPSVSYAVRINRQPVLLSVITALLDSTMLAKFPTCNFEAVWKACGRDGEEKEFARLRALQDTTDGQRNRSLGDEAWQLCKSLGQAIEKTDTIGQKLAQALLFEANTTDFVDTLESCSLEWECFKRVRLLMSIVGIFLEHTPLEFEKVCSHIISKSSEELILASKRLSFYHTARANENAGASARYRQAKLTELVSCYSEMHVTLLAWILRQPGVNHSANFKASLQSIRNSFFASVVVKDQKLAAQSLQRLTSVSRTLLLEASTGKLGDSAPPIGAVTHQVVAILQSSFVRRSRDVLIHISNLSEEDNDQRLLYSLVAVGIGKTGGMEEEDVKTYGHELAFSLSQVIRKPLNLQNATTSPLQSSVGKYIVESKHPPTASEMQALQKLKHVILGKHLLPRLRLNPVVSDDKAKQLTIRLVKDLLDAENKTSFSLIGEEKVREINLFSLRALTNGLVVAIRYSLDPKCIDTTLVSTLFQLAKSLASSLISTTSNGLPPVPPSTMTVAKWGRSLSSPSGEIVGTSKPEELVASYLWFSLLWIKAIAEAIVDQSEGATERLQGLCKRVQADKKMWPLVSNEMEISLAFLTEHFFPEKKKASNIVNIYAKKPQAAANGEEEDSVSRVWTPDTYDLKAAKNFLVELIPLC